MEIEQLLQQLKSYENQLVQIGDVNVYRQTNNKEFLQLWTMFVKTFEKISLATKNNIDLYSEALDIITDLEFDNPSLEAFVESIFQNEMNKSKTNSQNDLGNRQFDTSSLANKIESYVSEISNLQFWNESEIGDIKWALEEYQKQLISHQQEFDPQLYSSLMNDINVSLNKIAKFNGLMESELMDSVKHM